MQKSEVWFDKDKSELNITVNHEFPSYPSEDEYEECEGSGIEATMDKGLIIFRKREEVRSLKITLNRYASPEELLDYSIKFLMLENIEVYSEYYSNFDGVLYDKDKKTLLVIPHKKGKVILPESVEDIWENDRRYLYPFIKELECSEKSVRVFSKVMNFKKNTTILLNEYSELGKLYFISEKFFKCFNFDKETGIFNLGKYIDFLKSSIMNELNYYIGVSEFEGFIEAYFRIYLVLKKDENKYDRILDSLHEGRQKIIISRIKNGIYWSLEDDTATWLRHTIPPLVDGGILDREDLAEIIDASHKLKDVDLIAYLMELSSGIRDEW